jgi:hypothetical protein
LLIAEILVYFPLPLAPVPDDEPEPDDESLPQPITLVPRLIPKNRAKIIAIIFRFMFSPPFSFYSPKSNKAITVLL